jgi:hypothetical protein
MNSILERDKKMKYFNKIVSSIIIYLLLIISFSCTPTRLTRERELKIKNKPYGYIVFDFNGDLVVPKKLKCSSFGSRSLTYWFLNLKINEEVFFSGGFGVSSKYIIPVPVGDVTVSYKLRADGRTGGVDYIFSTRSTPKILRLKIENGQKIYLKIVKVDKPKKGVGCVGGGAAGMFLLVPWPSLYQEVAFKVVPPEKKSIKDNIPLNPKSTPHKPR